jgi:DNA-directed RNA polymerase subunit RPC12/RpoP
MYTACAAVHASQTLEVFSMVEGRCMKCKKQVPIAEGKEVVMKNGMKAMSGHCPHCKTKVFRILGKA